MLVMETTYTLIGFSIPISASPFGNGVSRDFKFCPGFIKITVLCAILSLLCSLSSKGHPNTSKSYLLHKRSRIFTLPRCRLVRLVGGAHLRLWGPFGARPLTTSHDSTEVKLIHDELLDFLVPTLICINFTL